MVLIIIIRKTRIWSKGFRSKRLSNVVRFFDYVPKSTADEPLLSVQVKPRKIMSLKMTGDIIEQSGAGHRVTVVRGGSKGVVKSARVWRYKHTAKGLWKTD